MELINKSSKNSEFIGRPISYKTYRNFADKYGIDIKNKKIEEIQKLIYNYEMENIDKLNSGLYIIDCTL